MEPKINEIANRIKVLRDIFGYSAADMAQALGISEEEYVTYEEGKQDFTFTSFTNVRKSLMLT